MTFDEVKKEVESGNYHPVYLLHGEESYFIDELVKLLESKVLSEAEKPFNLTILYGRDTKALQIIEAARRLPMMAPCQLIIVKEAQYLKDINVLESYLDHIVPTTILVIVHKNKKADGRKKVFVKMKQKGAVFYSKGIFEKQLPPWIHNYLNEKGYQIDQKAAILLTEYLGTNLSKVSNELNKLLINKEKNINITTKDIEKYIGISKDYNAFELPNAMSVRDKKKIYRIMNYMIANQKSNPFPVILGTLYSYFSKAFVLSQFKPPQHEIFSQLGISPFQQSQYTATINNYSPAKLEEVILLLGEYDLRSKGVNNDNIPHTELLKELVFKILN